MYPSSRSLLIQRFFPSKNSSDTIFLFARILGIGIVFSEFSFYMSDGFVAALLDFFIRAVIVIIMYLVYNYIIEGIVLYNFEYNDEVVKRKNMSYSLVSLAHSLGSAFILKSVLSVSQSSIIYLFFLWLFSIVLLGFATKTFSIMSQLEFNRLLIQKNMAVSFSYMGFLMGWSILISSAMSHQLQEVKWYTIQVVLKLLLSLIILPIFIKGIKWIFKIQDDLKEQRTEKGKAVNEVEIGYGIYEGIIFFTCCFLTIVITGQINFGTFYPVF